MNTTNTIYTSYLDSVYADQVTTVNLENIINRIRSNEFQSIAEKIRLETDNHKQKQLKQKVPAFFPCLVLNNEKNAYNEQTELNGIIQFDIDAKDNVGIDFNELRGELLKIKEIIYLFSSPRNGLKLGIMSDLKHNTADDIESLKSRFTKAYVITESYLHHQLPKFTIDYDNSAKHKLACYLSHDPDAYFNPDCAIFNVNSQCVYKKQESRLVDNLPEDASRVEELLPYISRDLGYDDRLQVNSVVIDALGYIAIALLEAHWITTDRKKLRKDLESQLKKSGTGTFKPNFGILVNFAKANGWQPITGVKRNTLTAQETKQELQPLLSPQEATLKLKSIIESFLEDKQSRFINFSTGAGKTYSTLQVLGKLSWQTKILYLVKSHALAEEITATFRSIRAERSEQRSPKEQRSFKSRIDHIKGRSKLCENDSVITADVPVYFCHADAKRDIGESDTCLYQAECRYTLQFNNQGNIRVMTHNEFVNQQAKYFNGVDPNGEPSKGKWIPDYLIVDEDIFTVEKDYSEPIDSRFPSIVKIIKSVQSGLELKDAIMEHKIDLFFDSVENKFNSPKEFKIKAIKEKEKEDNGESTTITNYSQLFVNITQYALNEELYLLKGMRVVDQAIIQSTIKPVAIRYKHIPTLFLDATANKAVIAQLLPDAEFHSISVKSKDEINLYQLQNKVFTKEQLKKNGVLADVIFGLKTLAEKYTKDGKAVGLITYKTINDEAIKEVISNAKLKDFDEYLANEAGIEMYAHFGGLRGLNKFNDVDCLIILGRYCLPPDAVESNTWAIFNESGGDWGKHSVCYVDSPVRMKDGAVMGLNSQIYLNDKKRAVGEHYSLSETQQAIGRGRMIHGNAKDIYYLSGEYIGSDIEVTGFISFNDYFSRKLIDEDYRIINPDKLMAVMDLGFIRTGKGGETEMKRTLGLSDYEFKNNKDLIYKEIKDVGFVPLKISYKNFDSKIINHEYFVKDKELLLQFLKPKIKDLFGFN